MRFELALHAKDAVLVEVPAPAEARQPQLICALGADRCAQEGPQVCQQGAQCCTVLVE